MLHVYDNSRTLVGRILDDGNGAGDVAVKEASVWSMTGDSVVNYLALDGGTINFRGGNNHQPVPDGSDQS